MKTVVILGPKQVQFIDAPNPKCDDHFVLVRIHSAPMCTEYRKYFAGDKSSNLGHEAAGEVIEVFPGSKVKVGQRVIVMPQYPCGKCDLCLQGDYIHCENINDPVKNHSIQYGTGTFAEFILKPDWLLIPIPDDISYDEAAMACCGLGPAFGAATTMAIDAGDTVLVTGLGPVGLGAIICSAYRGARVIAAGRNNYRRSLASQLGAELVIDPDDPEFREKILAVTNGKGVGKVIECAGEESYQSLAIMSAKRKGQVAFIGESGAFTIDVSKDLLRKGLTLHGIWHWNLKHSEEIIKLIRVSKEKLNILITHRFPLHKIEEAFQLQLTADCGKIILQP
jgi:L-iditol 2-dehydrogenase